MMGIFEQLAWLTTRVKRLCCAVDKINESGAGSYKVYTALISQGESNNEVNVNSGDLTIGVTYWITTNSDNAADWTNVGAPNNDVNTYFVATGTTPNSWGIDGNLKYNEAGPVATVLQNTIGNIWFTYIGTGVYSIGSDGLFTLNKTAVFNTVSTDVGYPKFIDLSQANVNEVYLQQFDNIGNALDNITNATIEIRVYN